MYIPLSPFTHDKSFPNENFMTACPLFSALDHEGLYRLAGVKSRVEDAKTRFDRGIQYSLVMCIYFIASYPGYFFFRSGGGGGGGWGGREEKGSGYKASRL